MHKTETIAPPPNKPLEILVVDNDDILCRIHRSKLNSRFSLPVSFHYNGQEALFHIKKNSNTDFLVLLEIEMPLMNAWDFLSECSRNQFSSELHVFMLSCSVSRADKELAKSFPQVVDYFEKPLIDSHLNSIEEFLEDRKETRTANQ